MFKFVFFLIVSGSTIFTRASEQYSNSTLKVTLYYESLCPYCKQFVLSQLYPGFKKLDSYLEMDLVPYGNAKQNKTNDSWEFKCQHGPKECLGNKIHACGIAEGKGQEKNMEFIYCLFNSSKPVSDGSVVKCASKLGVSSDSILSCAKGTKGDELLAHYGDRTKAIRPLIKGVPSIFFNNEYDEELDESAVDNFLGTACEQLENKPNACTNDTLLNESHFQ